MSTIEYTRESIAKGCSELRKELDLEAFLTAIKRRFPNIVESCIQRVIDDIVMSKKFSVEINSRGSKLSKKVTGMSVVLATPATPKDGKRLAMDFTIIAYPGMPGFAGFDGRYVECWVNIRRKATKLYKDYELYKGIQKALEDAQKLMDVPLEDASKRLLHDCWAESQALAVGKGSYLNRTTVQIDCGDDGEWKRVSVLVDANKFLFGSSNIAMMYIANKDIAEALKAK